MGPQDGLFRGVDGQPFRYSWQKAGQVGYRLELVTELPGTFKVPVSADQLVVRAALPDTLIVVSERGGGLSHFIAWLCQSEERPSNGRRTRGDTDASKTPRSSWSVMDLDESFKEIARWRRQTGKKARLQLVMDRTQAAERHTEDAEGMLAEIAGVIESKEWKDSKSKLFVTTREIQQLSRDTLYSSMLSRGMVCRLPHFSVVELRGWAEEFLRKKLAPRGVAQRKEDLVVRLAEETKRWVGGQPTMTHFLFRRVEEAWNDKQPADLPRLFEQAGQYLQAHRPHIVERWALDLRDLLAFPHIRHRLEIYTSGATKLRTATDYDDVDAQLFLAGWLGLNPELRWGIRSLCHQQWAREILRGLSHG